MLSFFLSPGQAALATAVSSGHTAELRVAKGLSGQGLKEQDLLINAEAMQDHHQVLTTAGDLALHGQAEVLLHAFGDATSDCVVPEVSERETERDHGQKQQHGLLSPGQGSTRLTAKCSHTFKPHLKREAAAR